MRTKIPGVLTAIAVGATSIFIASFSPVLGSVLLALLLGMLVGNLIPHPKALNEGLKFSEKNILEFAIVLIGFGFDGQQVADLSFELALSILLVVVSVLLISTLLGKLLKVDRDLSLLIGAGNAICGSAAVAAMAPLLKANENQVGLSLGIINLLGVMGLVFLPALSFVFDLSHFDTGFLIGASLQSVGHVAASSFALNETVGEWAMMIKMGRVFLLIPLLIFMHFLGKKRNPDVTSSFPWFIIVFVAAVYVSQAGFVSDSVIDGLANVGTIALCVAMAAIGMRIKIRPLLTLSGRGILLGMLLFSIQVLMVLGLVFAIQELA